MLRPDKPWDKNLQLLLVGIIAFNTVPLFSEMPPWASVLTVVFLGWKTLYLWRGVTRPPRWALYLMSIAATAGVFVSYGTIIGQEAASVLLVVLTSAKLLETNRYRDAMIVIFTSYFLLMAHLLVSQSLLSTVYMATDVMMITSLMFQAHKSDRRTSIRSLRPVMKLLALALPVWIFLFIFFPRFSTGAWGLTQSKHRSAGFSEKLDPGEVSKLTDNDDPAFRVTFKAGEAPPMANLYWRGAVLTKADGLKWERPKNEKALSAGTHLKQVDRAHTSYTISLEPSYRNWLFLLDYPEDVTLDSNSTLLKSVERYGFIYQTSQETLSRLYYQGISTDLAPGEQLDTIARDPLLELPSDTDPRVLALGKELRAKAEKANGPPAIADRVSDEILDWFVAQKFRYTKEPGSLQAATGSGQLAKFLFERKRGFCEHYAAAFATLARAAGIPARVTVGFQGGKFNDLGDYLLVRGLDAHAWAEVWRDDVSNPGRGRWTRVDPTSVIAPLRLKIGGDFNSLEEALQAVTPEEYQRRVANHFADLSIRIELAWDAVQMRWNSFLNSYDFEFQKALLESLGWNGLPRLALGAIALCGVALIVGAIAFVLRRSTRKKDPLVTEWMKFCRKIERAGLEPKRANEGALDFAARAAKKWPAYEKEIQTVAKLYCELRYGPNADHDLAKAFRQSARRFSIEANSRSATS